MIKTPNHSIQDVIEALETVTRLITASPLVFARAVAADPARWAEALMISAQFSGAIASVIELHEQQQRTKDGGAPGQDG